MQDSIIDDNGVAPLLSLVRDGSKTAQEHAASTMWHLSTTAENQKVVVENYAITDLVTLMKSGTPMAQYYCAAALSELADGAVRNRDKANAKRRSRPSSEEPAVASAEDAGAGKKSPLKNRRGSVMGASLSDLQNELKKQSEAAIDNSANDPGVKPRMCSTRWLKLEALYRW